MTQRSRFLHSLDSLPRWFFFGVILLSHIICVTSLSDNKDPMEVQVLSFLNTTDELDDGNENYSVLEEEEQLAVVVTFEDILKLTVFIAVAWAMSNLSVRLGLPGLVGEIITGFLLGPPLADFCPFPEAMVLIGNFGLLGLMLESGIYLDIAQLRETGTRAVLMAVSGTLLGVGTGTALGYLPLSEATTFSAAMSVGAAFAPSSLGVAAAVLSAGEVLNTPIGQLIVASSVVDDVLGLILLAILNVFVMDDPSTFNFIQPFLASFGFLIILGYLGITWIPSIIQNKILPRIPNDHQDKATFAIMFTLMMVYLPLLNYSGASYLTGAFLAGLSVSQLPNIHKSYAHNGRELMVWLMRIFFAATIGFQVPITRYNNWSVVGRAAKFLIPVLAKLPLGLLIPRFQKQPPPSDFPFDPYWRDVWITALSVMCRGEFNFVVASFGLSSGLLDADTYSAIVLAVLVSSILGPLLLSQTIAYYNRLSEEYISAPHLLNRVDKSSPDGYRPLFIAIQIRTPISWGLHERFQHALQELGDLLILDHRTFHTNGLDAVAMTELFVRDTSHNVEVKNCFQNESYPSSRSSNSEEGDLEKEETITDTTSSTGDSRSRMSALGDESQSRLEYSISNSTGSRNRREHPSLGLCGQWKIQQRLDAIKVALEGCLEGIDSSKYVIQVSQWEPFLQEAGEGHHRQRTYTFSGFDEIMDEVQPEDRVEDPLSQVFDDLSVDISIDVPPTPIPVSASHQKVEEKSPCMDVPPTKSDMGQPADSGTPMSVMVSPTNTTEGARTPTLLPALPRPPRIGQRAKSHGDHQGVLLLSSTHRPSALKGRATSTGHTAKSKRSVSIGEEPMQSPPSAIPRPSTLRHRSISLGQSPTASYAFSPRHRRRSSHATGQLSADLWSTDAVAHRSVRRDSYIVPPTVAGQAGEEADDLFLALARATPSEGGSVVLDEESGVLSPSSIVEQRRRRANSYHDSQDVVDHETEAIHQKLHGYCRRLEN